MTARVAGLKMQRRFSSASIVTALAGAIVVWRRPIVSIYVLIVGVAVHNAVGAALYGAGVRGGALTAIQAWKEILLAVGLARVGADVVRARALPFRTGIVDALALAYGALVCIYALIPQHVLGGSADAHAVGLALKHNLVPVGAYFLGRSLGVQRDELVRIAWTIIGAAAALAALGLIDVYAISIFWWRNSRSSDSRRSRPVSRYSTETLSFFASIRSAFTDGVRAPASMREMYAYETPGDERSRCENPHSNRRRLSRTPIGSARSSWFVLGTATGIFRAVRTYVKLANSGMADRH